MLLLLVGAGFCCFVGVFVVVAKLTELDVALLLFEAAVDGRAICGCCGIALVDEIVVRG